MLLKIANILKNALFLFLSKKRLLLCCQTPFVALFNMRYSLECEINGEISIFTS